MKTKNEISLSVIKDLYTNLHSFDSPLKDLVKRFLSDKPAILEYVEDLKHDIKVIDFDFDTTSYEKGIKELTALANTL